MSVSPHPDEPSSATRRGFLLGSATLTLGSGLGMLALSVRPADATPASMRAAIRQVVGDAPVKKGRLKLDLPPLIENGNTVPLTITGESPMTAEDHIKAIHVFTEKNPQPNVVSVFLGPRAGKANVSTRIRLADSQKVVGIAQMSDGSFWSEEVEIIVTLAACLEES
jgi:sulfur-oxidizing protein SoxY